MCACSVLVEKVGGIADRDEVVEGDREDEAQEEEGQRALWGG